MFGILDSDLGKVITFAANGAVQDVESVEKFTVCGATAREVVNAGYAYEKAFADESDGNLARFYDAKRERDECKTAFIIGAERKEEEWTELDAMGARYFWLDWAGANGVSTDPMFVMFYGALYQAAFDLDGHLEVFAFASGCKKAGRAAWIQEDLDFWAWWKQDMAGAKFAKK